MIIPSVPPTTHMVDHNGHIKEDWRTFFELLTRQLQSKASENGIVVPTVSDATMTNVLSDPSISGGIVYNSDTTVPHVNVKGTFKGITTGENLPTAQIQPIPAGTSDSIRLFHDTTTNTLKVGFNNSIRSVTTTP